MKFKVEGTKLTKTVEVNETKEVSYEYEFLLSQQKQIQSDIDRNKAELDNVNELLAEAEKGGAKEAHKEKMAKQQEVI